MDEYIYQNRFKNEIESVHGNSTFIILVKRKNSYIMPKLAVQCLVEVKTYFSVVFLYTKMNF